MKVAEKNRVCEYPAFSVTNFFAVFLTGASAPDTAAVSAVP